MQHSSRARPCGKTAEWPKPGIGRLRDYFGERQGVSLPVQVRLVRTRFAETQSANFWRDCSFASCFVGRLSTNICRRSLPAENPDNQQAQQEACDIRYRIGRTTVASGHKSLQRFDAQTVSQHR